MKPSEKEAKELGKLFPSCAGSSSKKRGPSFDPNERLYGLPDRKKKKKGSTSQGRPVTVSICWLPRFTPSIPKGKVRNRLKEQNRIRNVKLTRSMNPSTVRESVSRAFPDIQTQWIYLETGQDNFLAKAEQQSLDGNTVCSRRGCVYILDQKVGVDL